MEMAKIVIGQRYRETDEQLADISRETCLQPRARESIMKEFIDESFRASKDERTEFGLEITRELLKVDARILLSPVSGRWSRSTKVDMFKLLEHAHRIGSQIL